jgi:hypothetical protein
VDFGLRICCIALLYHFLFKIENLVLRARSEMIGCAVNICHGMMEYWNVGILGLAE